MNTLIRIIAIGLVSISSISVFAEQIPGEATYYSDRFEGRKTSNGEVFSQSGFTAAYCGVPLGKNIFVSRGSTGVLVRVNDRPGSCNGTPSVDLSTRAFSLLGPLSSGRLRDIQIDTHTPLPRDEFSALGVELTEDIPSVFFSGEGRVIRGKVLDGKKRVIIILENKGTGFRKDFFFSVDTSGNFVAPIEMPDVPDGYSLIILSERVGQLTLPRITRIRVVPYDTFYSDTKTAYSFSTRPVIRYSEKKGYIDLDPSFFGILEIEQKNRITQFRGGDILFGDTNSLEQGPAKISLGGYLTHSGGSLDRSIFYPTVFSGTVLLGRTQDGTGSSVAKIRNYKNYSTLQFRVPQNTKIQEHYFLTLPTGDVLKSSFAKEYIGSGKYLIPGKTITLNLPTKEEGTYRIEVNTDEGIAYINLPIHRGTVWNILPPYPLGTEKNIKTKKNLVENSVISRINLLRSDLSRNPLTQDVLLTKIAQAKVDDMIARNYSSHLDPDGNMIWGFAKKRGMNYSATLGENIAVGNVSDRVLQDGLEQSGGHRYAMISPDFQKVGIGYGIKGDMVYLVQIFGAK